MSSAYFVATRFLTAKVWVNPEKLLSAYQGELVALKRGFQIGWSNQGLRISLSHVLNAARPLADWVIQTRSIPAGKSKAVELAARLVTNIARVPTDAVAWYGKNSGKLDLLLEAAQWGERASTESDDNLEVATVGPFKVHNTIGANAKQLGEIKGIVENAVRSLGTTLDFRKVLYGDVFIVGQLKQSTTLAWYSVTEDDVYVRSLMKKGIDSLKSLTHELGHRYWFKFFPTDAKQRVLKLYYDLGSQRPELPDLKVGDLLPVEVRGAKGPITIVSRTGLTLGLSTGGAVSMMDVQKFLRNKAVFPTVYAAKNVEEFFAECFAFYTMGTLKPDLAAQFEAAIKG